MLKNAGQTASLCHHSAVNSLAQELLVDESQIFFFSIPIGMKTVLKTKLDSALPEAEISVQFLR